MNFYTDIRLSPAVVFCLQAPYAVALLGLIIVDVQVIFAWLAAGLLIVKSGYWGHRYMGASPWRCTALRYQSGKLALRTQGRGWQQAYLCPGARFNAAWIVLPLVLEGSGKRYCFLLLYNNTDPQAHRRLRLLLGLKPSLLVKHNPPA